MKRYNSIYELASELDAKGYVKDADIFIPARYEPDSFSCRDGQLLAYPEHKAYYIINEG